MVSPSELAKRSIEVQPINTTFERYSAISDTDCNCTVEPLKLQPSGVIFSNTAYHNVKKFCLLFTAGCNSCSSDNTWVIILVVICYVCKVSTLKIMRSHNLYLLS